MRSTQIALFLILLNAAAGVIAGGIAPAADAAPSVGGDSEIEESADRAENINASRSGLDDFVGGIFQATDFISDLKNVIFYGPEMLRNLGAPDLLIDGLQTVVIFVVGFDLLEILSGRELS